MIRVFAAGAGARELKLRDRIPETRSPHTQRRRSHVRGRSRSRSHTGPYLVRRERRRPQAPSHDSPGARRHGQFRLDLVQLPESRPQLVLERPQFVVVGKPIRPGPGSLQESDHPSQLVSDEAAGGGKIPLAGDGDAHGSQDGELAPGDVEHDR